MYLCEKVYFMKTRNVNTTSDYLNFDATLNKAIRLLKKDKKKYKIAFLTIVGINVGLRISDILNLKHKDLQGDTISLIEQKTGKNRLIKINDAINDAYIIYCEKLKLINSEDYLFISQKGGVFTIRQVNRLLKSIFGTKDKNVSSHSLRKTFGRRVWQNDGESERALIMLSKIFNHTSTSTTRIYLGIQQEEINDIYMNL